MKKKVGKYISGLLLFCLALQFVPFGVLHSHNESHRNSEHQHDCHPANTALFQSDDHSSADFQFEASDDCDLCDLLLALNDRSIIAQSAASSLYLTPSKEIYVHTYEIPENIAVSSQLGRAPPIA